jgi:hypothetical protein
MMKRLLVFLAAALTLTACYDKGALERSRVEYVRVNGRLFEVRIATTDTANEFRMLVLRGTIVINPDPELERERALAVSRQFMDRTCRGRPFQILEDKLVDNINFFTRFRCQP